MNRLNILAVAASISLAGVALLPSRASAQGMPVYDNTNFIELVQQLQNGTQQLTQLQSQLTAQINMIKSLPSTLVPGVGQLAEQTQQLMQQISTIQNMGTNLQSQITGLYPTNFSNLSSVQGVLSQLATMQGTTRSAYQNSMQLQSQVAANQPQISAAIQAADGESMGAAGSTGAVQASNQILGTMSQQLGDQQALLVAQYNAQAQQYDEGQSENAAATQAQTIIWQGSPPATVTEPNPFPNADN